MKIVSLFQYRGVTVKILNNGHDAFPFEYKITLGKCRLLNSRTSYTTLRRAKVDARNDIDAMLMLHTK